MNWEQVEGNWKVLRGKIREQWGKVTDDDLDVIAGKQEQLAGTLEKKYGLAKEAAQKQIKSWLNSIPDPTSDKRSEDQPSHR